MSKTTDLRKLLNVPKEQRIAQYIYNQFRDYEQKLQLDIYQGNKLETKTATGIDIFYVEDEEFINRFEA